MTADFVYLAGFVVALLFVLFGIDDLLWDVYSLFRRRKSNTIDIEEASRKIPQMMAISIAAWHEHNVIKDVVDHLVTNNYYPQGLYRVFVGVYPNDKETMRDVEDLVRMHRNVVMVVNEKEGPTSKADNLNCILKSIKKYEKDHSIRFASVTIHDSEDVIHPYELGVTNYLIDDYDALQFPVFPLQKEPSLRNFFRTLTQGTYADEFAESHFRTLVVRDKVGFVPSAGTGFAIKRSVLEALGEEAFPKDSLTEDYLLSLQMKLKGFRVHYVLEKVSRVISPGHSAGEYIATRSMFPRSFGAAVRQKTRWVYGISMQSAHVSDIFNRNALSMRERLLLYKDQKAKFSNFILLPGHLILLYFFLHMFYPALPLVFPRFSVSWWLCVFLSVMMLERQALRGLAIKEIYGIKMAFFATLLPPFLPIRFLWGNVINFTATLSAWKRNYYGSAGRQARNRNAVHWCKTDHEFLPEEDLVAYQRMLGDSLLVLGYTTQEELSAALMKAGQERRMLGEVLVEENVIEESQLLHAYALHRKTAPINRANCIFSSICITPEESECFAEKDVIPLMRSSRGWIVAAQTSITIEDIKQMIHFLGKPVFCLFEETEPPSEEDPPPAIDATMIEDLLDEGKLTLSQAGLAVAFASRKGKPLVQILHDMGLMRKAPRFPCTQHRLTKVGRQRKEGFGNPKRCHAVLD